MFGSGRLMKCPLTDTLQLLCDSGEQPPLSRLRTCCVEAADAAADRLFAAVDAAQTFGNALNINFVAQVTLYNPVGGKNNLN